MSFRSEQEALSINAGLSPEGLVENEARRIVGAMPLFYLQHCTVYYRRSWVKWPGLYIGVPVSRSSVCTMGYVLLGFCPQSVPLHDYGRVEYVF